MAWLVTLLPTHSLKTKDCDAAAWNERLDKVMALQEAFASSSFWTSLCMGLLARMAKHDEHGALVPVALLRAGSKTAWWRQATTYQLP